MDGYMRNVGLDSAPTPGEFDAFERVAARLIGPRAPRTKLGRYALSRELGRGGFGAVYAGHDPKLARDVAIKLVLPRKGSASAKWEARLVREARTLAQVKHANVVTVYDVGVDAGSGGVYVVMELLQGRSMRAWVRGPTKPSTDHVIDAFARLARGLAAAHALGIVHRDVKPGNLMITHAGGVKLIDFGLARDAADLENTDRSQPSPSSGSGTGSDALTSMGTVMGTPPYMAPEQHHLGELGPATDQFALCVSLFEVLYGVRPFVADDVEAYHRAKLKKAVVAPPGGHGVPTSIHRVIMRGLEPKPSKRWASMEAFAIALEHAAQPRRRTVGLLVGGVVAVAVAVLGARSVAGEEDPCRALMTRAEAVWSPARADALAQRALADAQGSDVVVWTHAQRRIGSRMESWRTALDASCPAENSGSLDCLDRWLRDADTVLEVLEEGELVAASALSVVDTLPTLDACGSGQGTSRVDDGGLRDAFIRARAMARAGRGEHAVELADSLLDDAGAIEDEALLAQASLTAGFVYAERQRLDDARRVLIDAVDLADAAGLDAVAAESAIILVRVSGSMGRFDDAHRWAALAEARISRLGDPQYLQTLLLGARAFELIYEGDYARAYALSSRLVERLDGDDQGYERARAMANVAMTAFELGRMHEARAVAARARELMVSILGERHPTVGRSMADEGRYAAAAGEVQEGIASMRRGIELLEAAAGPNDPYAMNAKRALAHYLSRVGRFDEALTMLEQSYAATVALYGTVHVRTATTAFALADHYLMADRPQDAVPLVREAVTTLTELYGAQSPRLAVGAELLGRALAQQGQLTEARDVATRALAGLSEATPGERESAVNLTMVLADIDRDEGRLDDAVRNLERAIRLTSGDPTLADPSVLASLQGGRALAEAERGRSERAAEAATLALRNLDQIGASDEEKAPYHALVAAEGDDR